MLVVRREVTSKDPLQRRSSDSVARILSRGPPTGGMPPEKMLCRAHRRDTIPSGQESKGSISVWSGQRVELKVIKKISGVSFYYIKEIIGIEYCVSVTYSN